MTAHRRHLANTIELVLLSAHPSLEPKQQIDRFSHFYTAPPFLPKLPLPIGGSGPPSNTWFLGPTQVLNPNCISIGAFVFAGSPV